jgi:hypothetical protein
MKEMNLTAESRDNPCNSRSRRDKRKKRKGYAKKVSSIKSKNTQKIN